MKVYLLFRWDDIVPELVGVYTSYKLAKAHMNENYDEIVETFTDIDPNRNLAWPERG